MCAFDPDTLTPQRLMTASVVVALITIVMTGAAWIIAGSVGLLSDAMESFVNLASALFGLLMLTIAQRPVDVEHPCGYREAEYFSSGFVGRRSADLAFLAGPDGRSRRARGAGQHSPALATFSDRQVRFDHVITRRSGQRRYVDVHIHMPAHGSLGQAAGLRTRVEQALIEAVPGLRPTLQMLPTDVEPATDDELVRAAAVTTPLGPEARQ